MMRRITADAFVAVEADVSHSGDVAGASVMGEFLLTEMALGVSVELSSKLRAVVDGAGLRKGSVSLKWKFMGPAADSYRTNTRTQAQWGPEVGRQFSELCERLSEARGASRRLV